MGQEFHVVRCCSCAVFQVHQVKKTTKWACKMCGQKQSIKKVYGQGTGADCRRHVQKLNMMQGEMDESATLASGSDFNEEQSENTTHDEEASQVSECVAVVSQASRWQQFVDIPGEAGSDAEEEGTSDFTTDRKVFDQAKKQNRYKKRPRVEEYDGNMIQSKRTAGYFTVNPAETANNLPREENRINSTGGTYIHHAVYASDNMMDQNNRAPAQQSLSSQSSRDTCTAYSDKYGPETFGTKTCPGRGDLTYAQFQQNVTAMRSDTSKQTPISPPREEVLFSQPPAVNQVSLNPDSCVDVAAVKRHTKKLSKPGPALKPSSKWAKFVETKEDAEDEEECAEDFENNCGIGMNNIQSDIYFSDRPHVQSKIHVENSALQFEVDDDLDGILASI